MKMSKTNNDPGDDVLHRRMRRLTKLLFTIFFLLQGLGLIQLSLSALEPETPLEQYLKRHWELKNGFPSNRIQAIGQTSEGYMWFGTPKGLVQFDGTRFRLHVVGDNPTPLDMWISDFLLDRNGALWMTSRWGLIRYKNKTFTTYTKKDGLSDELTLSIEEDLFGDLWIGTGRHYINRYRNGKFSLIAESNGFTAGRALGIQKGRNGNLWVAAGTDGVFIGKEGKFRPYQIDELPATYVAWTIYEDRNGTVWVGTFNGLMEITKPMEPLERKLKIYTRRDGLSHNRVISILEDKDDNLWVGTRRGLNRIKRNRSGHIIIHNMFNDLSAFTLFEDMEKNIWIGSMQTGLWQLKNRNIKNIFQNKNHLLILNHLFKTRTGEILLSCTDNNIYRYSAKEERFLQYLNPLPNMKTSIISMTEDRRGTLWFGTLSDGLFQVINGNALNRHNVGGPKRSRSVWSVICAVDGKIWAATRGNGLWVFDNSQISIHKTILTTKDGLPDNDIFNIFEDSENNIWVATRNGLAVIKNDTWENYSSGRITNYITTYFTGTAISALHQDKDGVMWIGTHKSGLIRFNNDTPVRLTTENGLGSNSIIQIFEDRRDYFWISSPEGIMRIDRKELNDFADGKKKRIDCISLGMADGMLTHLCTASMNHSIVQANENELWFATEKGISIIQPDNLKLNDAPAPVTLEHVLFNGEPVPVDETEDTGPIHDNDHSTSPNDFNENNIHKTGKVYKGIKNLSFKFNSPTFVSPRDVKLYYRLVGHENDWNVVDTYGDRNAYYKDLPDGTYRFEVTTTNSNGIWNNRGIAFAFTLKSYIYETAWFKTTAALLLLALMLLISLWFKRYLYLRKLKNKYKNSALDPEKSEEILRRLHLLMETQKVYKDEELTLTSLAEKISVGAKHLSQVMNECLEKNYSEYINGYRIEEAKKLLTDPGRKNLTILEIAFEVGFNTKETFNRAFKKHTKMTPSHYKKSHIFKVD
jgi:ligand-binding sensor domain-containing protein/AraC-like DNA-binding protein